MYNIKHYIIIVTSNKIYIKCILSFFLYYTAEKLKRKVSLQLIIYDYNNCKSAIVKLHLIVLLNFRIATVLKSYNIQGHFIITTMYTHQDTLQTFTFIYAFA